MTLEATKSPELDWALPPVPPKNDGLDRDTEIRIFTLLAVAKRAVRACPVSEFWEDRLKRLRSFLVESNLALVYFWVHRFRKRRGRALDDAFLSAGLLGLNTAVERFTLARRLRFNTCASTIIKNELIHVIRTHNKHASRETRHDRSLGLVPDDREANAREQSDDLEALHHAIDTADLNDREREILRLRFFERHTLDQIGQALGLSKERIRQQQEIALAKLREEIAHPGRAALDRAYAIRAAEQAIAAAELSGDERRCAIMHYVGGLWPKDIAARMNISSNVAWTMLQSVRKKIGKILP